MKTYCRQNKVQKSISDIIKPFMKDGDRIAELKNAGIDTYTPLIYRIKLGAYLIALGISLFIPFTTSGLIIIGRRLLK